METRSWATTIHLFSGQNNKDTQCFKFQGGFSGIQTNVGS